MALDTKHAATRADELSKLVADLVASPANMQELDSIEWKATIDLTEKPRRAQVAKHLIGFANRDPETAQRAFEGNGYLIVGAEPGRLTGMQVHDAAALDDWLRPYTGDELRWSAQYVQIGADSVLVICVEPPRDGDPIYTFERESVDEAGKAMRAGAVYVRRGGKTHEATPSEHRRLQDRLRRHRTDLLVEPWWNAGQSGCWLGVNVSNPAAGMPTTVTEVGFRLAGPPAELTPAADAVIPPGEPLHATAYLRYPLPWQPGIQIQPGERRATRVPAVRIPALLDAESELVPYAIDIENVQHRGKPSPIFRWLLGSGWREDPNAEDPFVLLLGTYVTPAHMAGQTARFDLSRGTPSPAAR